MLTKSIFEQKNILQMRKISTLQPKYVTTRIWGRNKWGFQVEPRKKGNKNPKSSTAAMFTHIFGVIYIWSQYSKWFWGVFLLLLYSLVILFVFVCVKSMFWYEPCNCIICSWFRECFVPASPLFLLLFCHRIVNRNVIIIGYCRTHWTQYPTETYEKLLNSRVAHIQ